jgi:hypothetical protein
MFLKFKGDITILIKENIHETQKINFKIQNKNGQEIIDNQCFLLRKLVELRDKLKMSYQDYNL